jgi:hypothetical protein
MEWTLTSNFSDKYDQNYNEDLRYKWKTSDLTMNSSQSTTETLVLTNSILGQGDKDQSFTVKQEITNV